MSNTDSLSLAHASWNCKYHVVFAPKYRRREFYGLKRLEIGQVLRKLCERKGITIREAEVCPDHVHMLISIPPKFSVSGIMGCLKGKSSLMICQKWGNAKLKYRNREFWCRGYYVDTVGKTRRRQRNASEISSRKIRLPCSFRSTLTGTLSKGSQQ